LTQLIAFANTSYAILLADRRITVDGKTVEDEFNKVCVLFCNDARVAVAFTGLASYQTFNTSDWLVDVLAEIGEQTETLAEILEALAQQAKSKFSEFRSFDRRLTFLITGFSYWGPVPSPVSYVLSNFANTESLGDDFVLRAVPALDSLIVAAAGVINELPKQLEASFRNLLSKNLNPSSVLRFAVNRLKTISSNGRSFGLVGSQSNSAIIPAQPNTTITTTYHSAFNSYVAYGCNVVVTRGMQVCGSEIFSASVLAGPEIRKQSPCWCGSGYKFKHCHLKKFGAYYGKHPVFTAPLHSFSRITFELSRPSGNICCVASGYQ
jgi:hypothetical protein